MISLALSGLKLKFPYFDFITSGATSFPRNGLENYLEIVKYRLFAWWWFIVCCMENLSDFDQFNFALEAFVRLVW